MWLDEVKKIVANEKGYGEDKKNKLIKEELFKYFFDLVEFADGYKGVNLCEDSIREVHIELASIIDYLNNEEVFHMVNNVSTWVLHEVLRVERMKPRANKTRHNLFKQLVKHGIGLSKYDWGKQDYINENSRKAEDFYK